MISIERPSNSETVEQNSPANVREIETSMILETGSDDSVQTGLGQLQTYVDELRRESASRSQAVLAEAEAIIAKIRRVCPKITDAGSGPTSEQNSTESKGAASSYRFLEVEEQLEQGDEFSSDGNTWCGTHFSGQSVQRFEVGKYRRRVAALPVDENATSAQGSTLTGGVLNEKAISGKKGKYFVRSVQCIDFVVEAYVVADDEENAAMLASDAFSTRLDEVLGRFIGQVPSIGELTYLQADHVATNGDKIEFLDGDSSQAVIESAGNATESAEHNCGN